MTNPFLMIAAFVMAALLLVAIAYIADRLNIGKQNSENAMPMALTQEQMDQCLRYVRTFIECLKANYSSLGLCRPANPPQHMAPMGKWFEVHEGKRCLVVYADRIATIGMGEHRYDTTSAEKMKKKLQKVFFNYCIEAGLPPAEVVHAYDAGEGRVAFLLG